MSWFGGNSSAKLDEQLFNLKVGLFAIETIFFADALLALQFSSKQLEKMAKKCEKEQAVQKLKIKKV